MSSGLADLVCFGELLWDMLPNGKVAGGAPFNIVNRANALGLHAEVISSVGNDDLGDELIRLVQSKGNSISYIQRHSNLPTSVVKVKVGYGGEPNYDIVHPVAWDDININQENIDLVKNSRSFVYSSLGLRDERAREALFKILPYAKLKICDINLREGHYTQSTIMRMIEAADILRTNETELEMVSKWLGYTDMTRKEQIISLSERYKFDLVIATLGSQGAVCYKDGNWYDQPVFKVDVKDTVGAGDAFLASFIYQYLSDASIQKCLQFACAVGALTAAKDGGTPIITNEEISGLL